MSSSETPLGLPEPAKVVCSHCRDLGFVSVPDPDNQWSRRTKACVCAMRARPDPYPDVGEGTYTLANYRLERCPEAHRATELWLGHSAPPWVLLQGRTGNGKTHLLYAAFYDIFRRGEDGVVFQTVMLLNALRAGFNAKDEHGRDDKGAFDRLFKRVCEVPYLFLDDLGVEQGSAWDVQTVDTILNERYVGRRPTFLTTNLSLEALSRMGLERLRSRLSDYKVCKIVVVLASDMRPVKR